MFSHSLFISFIIKYGVVDRGYSSYLMMLNYSNKCITPIRLNCKSFNHGTLLHSVSFENKETFLLVLTDFFTKETNPYPFDFSVCGSLTTRQSL